MSSPGVLAGGDAPECTLCLCRGQGRIGGAYYSAADGVLWVLEISCWEDDLDVTVKLICLHAQPSLVLVAANEGDAFVSLCAEGHGGQSAARVEVKKIKASTLKLVNATRELARTAVLEGAPNDLRRCSADGERKIMFQCAGALVSVLSSEHAADEMARGPFMLAGVREHHMREFMYVDQMTLRSLDVFSFDVHQNMQGGRGKEGLSLFSVLDQTTSVVGRRLLRHWMLKPMLNSDVIAQRLDAVEFVKSMLEDDLGLRDEVKKIREELKRVKDVSRAVKRLSTLRTRHLVSEWAAVSEFCGAALMARGSVVAVLAATTTLEDTVATPEIFGDVLGASFGEAQVLANGTADSGTARWLHIP